MARFADGDGWEDPEDERKFYEQMAAGYTAATPVLREFLHYLDNMPRKRIISGRFVGTASHDMCAVATFCAARGFDWKRLLAIEKQSRLERFEALDGDDTDGDGGYGMSGATVLAGAEAGLPSLVAYNLAWKNDMVWDQITDHYEWIPTEYYARAARGAWSSEHHAELYGPHRAVKREGHWRYVQRDLTPEERWLFLRNHVAKRIDEPVLPGEPKAAEYPDTYAV